ncbi:MAG: [FeFe] hydrogenase H-cluster maturation GTPase HydF, partial [bacterium]|nr:[FeFe] hydrogenase H-cluster maturation GTPase HydF [bacterium]
GIDDLDDQLGEMRKKRSQKILAKTDLALLVADCLSTDFRYEDQLIQSFEKEKIPYIIALNKTDSPVGSQAAQWLKERSFVRVSALHKTGIDELKTRIREKAPANWEPPFLKDLLHPGELVVLVTPIDLGAPKGRLIMPQVKALRDVLDADCMPIMCKERELTATLEKLKEKPALVVTDSQVFPQVAGDVPKDIMLTSFSILSARQKGNLPELVEGVMAVKNLKPGDKVLIAESCTHHPLEDDIGRIKIPRWLNHYVGGGLDIETFPGYDFPENMETYKLAVHCGGCTLNRREMLKRQDNARDHNLPMTNYGVLISFLKSVFPRALEPFPEIYAMFKRKKPYQNVQLKRKMAELTDI